MAKFRNTLHLNRFPASKNQNLQAWDAADEYALEHICDTVKPKDSDKILVFNDSFGALCLSLSDYQVDVVTDSIVSELGIKQNAKLNDIDSVNVLNSLTAFTGTYDYLIIKIPKTLDYLRYFLAQVRPCITENTKIIVAGMVKSMPKRVWGILEETLGTTTTSLAKKKARLIFVTLEKDKTTTAFPASFQQENSNNIIFNHANVFSKQSLDIGTRFLIQNLPTFKQAHKIIDLGCGNGIVGLNLAKIYPQAQISFIDESYMAVASAKLTMQHNVPSVTQHRFIVNNVLDGFDKNCCDLIVCNPPFHQSHAVGLHIALQMFQQSFKTLNKGGHFLVVANRHLPYYAHLKRVFRNVETIANNSKFNLFKMQKL